MSTQKPPHIAGLAASGLLWLATNVAVAQVTPTPPRPAPFPAPASTPSSTFSVLLMSNGTVVRGEITEDPQAGVYRLKCRGGQVPYPKNAVKKAAATLEELYDFQVRCLPPRDPDERMKLVRWCLTEQLIAQAREQLTAVLAMCPDDVEATRMAKNMDANAEVRDRVDPELRRTSGELPQAEAPARLDPRILKHVRREYGNKALPEIFDLPPAVAVSRAADFARSVHPVLQQNCAGCHNERYQGEFQLVEIKLAKDLRNPDVARANLDATLRLINPDDPTRSDLLSNGLVPHGSKKNAIFKGPNDPQYQILSVWARSLRPAPPRGGATDLSRAGFESSEPSPRGGFGSDRPGREVPPVLGTPARRVPSDGEPMFGGGRNPEPRPARPPVLPSLPEAGPQPTMPEGDFPLPYNVGGPAPGQPAGIPGQAGRRATSPSPVKRPAEVAETPDASSVPDAAELAAGPRSVVVDPTEHPNHLPGMDKPLYPTPPRADSSAKKSKVDPALLEKLMKNRNASP